MWWPGVAMAGIIRHDGRLYSIRRLRGGVRTVAVVETAEDRMPPDHAPTPSRFRINDRNLRDDPLARTGDASELRTTIARTRSPADSSKSHDDRPSAGTTRSASTEIANFAQANVTINVIVAYTQKAASHYADPSRELVALSIELANQSFRNSKLGHVNYYSSRTPTRPTTRRKACISITFGVLPTRMMATWRKSTPYAKSMMRTSRF